MAEVERVEGLAVTRSGDRGGDTVVLVHGTMDRSAAFRRAARSLDALDVVAFDRRGYGESRTAGLSTTIAEQVRDLVTIVEWAGAGAVTLVGHSLGGLISLHAGAARPDLIASIGVWESPLPWYPWYGQRVGTDLSALAAPEAASTAAEQFLRMMIGDRLWERMPQSMKDERREESGALVADLTLCRRPEAEIDFVDVTLPVMVGTGARSAERFRTAAVTLRDGLPDAMMVEVADAEHGVHLSHPAEYAAFARAAVARRP